MTESTADQPNETTTALPPPLPPLLGGIVERVPRINIGSSNPIMTEVTPQTQMLDMMRTMNETMVKQQELFMKLLEDRDASHRRHETIEENVVIAGSGGTGDEICTDGFVTMKTRQMGRTCSYKTFLCCKPPEFAGADNPVTCMNWIREIEQAFRACDCEEGQKVKFGSKMLRSSALTWWNVFTSTLEASVLAKMTWATFKKKILEEYCNEQEMDMIEEEFRSLKKGNLSVREYTRLFMEKLNLVGHVAPTEKERVKAYLKGLPTDMMAMVCNSKATNLRETIEEAKVMERVYTRDKEEKARVGEKRRWESPQNSFKKSRFQTSDKRVDNRREAKWCPKCKSKHFVSCNSNPITCFKCGKPGHTSSDCSI